MGQHLQRGIELGYRLLEPGVVGVARPQFLERAAQVELDARPGKRVAVPRRRLARLLQHGDRLVEPVIAGVALAQIDQHIAQIHRGNGPVERRVLLFAGVEHQLERLGGTLERCRIAVAGPERFERPAEIVLDHQPVFVVGLARGELRRLLIGGNRLLQRVVVALKVAVVAERVRLGELVFDRLVVVPACDLCVGFAEHLCGRRIVEVERRCLRVIGEGRAKRQPVGLKPGLELVAIPCESPRPRRRLLAVLERQVHGALVLRPVGEIGEAHEFRVGGPGPKLLLFEALELPRRLPGAAVRASCGALEVSTPSTFSMP